MIERAIVQEMSSRDGTATRYERPAAIREMAHRVTRWKHGGSERCSSCSNLAVSVRQGMAYCAVCAEQRMLRYAPVSPVNRVSREAPTPPAKAIAGHFIVFDVPSVDLGGFREFIKPQAVDRALMGADVRALWGHDSSIPIGRTGPKTLTIRKDTTGLYAEILTPDWATNYVETVERGDVSGASFGFSVLDDEWMLGDNDSVVRFVYDMDVHEVSPVAFPAYPQTSIYVTKPAERLKREIDTKLRLVG